MAVTCVLTSVMRAQPGMSWSSSGIQGPALSLSGVGLGVTPRGFFAGPCPHPRPLPVGHAPCGWAPKLNLNLKLQRIPAFSLLKSEVCATKSERLSREGVCWVGAEGGAVFLFLVQC